MLYTLSQEKLTLGEYFKVKDFKDASNPNYPIIEIDRGLVSSLYRLERRVGPLVILKGFVVPGNNQYGLDLETHMHILGRAADIVCEGYTTKELALEASNIGFNCILAFLSKGFVHVDSREVKKCKRFVN